MSQTNRVTLPGGPYQPERMTADEIKENQKTKKVTPTQETTLDTEIDFDLHVDDLRIVKILMRMFIAVAKTIQDVMEGQAENLKLMNAELEIHTEKQKNIPVYQGDQLKHLIPGDGDKEVKERAELAKELNLMGDRSRDLSRMIGEIVKNAISRSQTSLQSTTNERMGMFDSLNTFISTANMLDSQVWMSR